MDDAHEIRPPKSRSYDAWHEKHLERMKMIDKVNAALASDCGLDTMLALDQEIQQQLAQQYAAEQSEPEDEELVKEYKDRRGE